MGLQVLPVEAAKYCSIALMPYKICSETWGEGTDWESETNATSHRAVVTRTGGFWCFAGWYVTTKTVFHSTMPESYCGTDYVHITTGRPSSGYGPSSPCELNWGPVDEGKFLTYHSKDTFKGSYPSGICELTQKIVRVSALFVRNKVDSGPLIYQGNQLVSIIPDGEEEDKSYLAYHNLIPCS